MADPRNSTHPVGSREVRVTRRPPSSIDVAHQAGVSQKTVSRVLNGEPYVREDLRRRVLEAARQLDYRPNHAARALHTGRTRRIGVVTLEGALHGPAAVVVGITRAARDSGYSLSVVSTFEGEPRGISGAVEALLAQGIDGLIMSEPVDEGPLDITVAVPLLAFGTVAGVSAPRIIQPGGPAGDPGYTATRHLLSLGHRTVYHIAGPRRWFSARDRVRGWRDALLEAGAPVPEILEGDWSAASGHAAGRQLLESRESSPVARVSPVAPVTAKTPVTAVFAANDDMAIGVIRALTEAGLRVPDEVSVVGHDDIPNAAYLNPPLTTIRQPFEDLTRAGFEALVQAIENPQAQAPAMASVPPRLIVRRSTAAPPPAQSL